MTMCFNVASQVHEERICSSTKYVCHNPKPPHNSHRSCWATKRRRMGSRYWHITTDYFHVLLLT
jgi:hypothetical protein